MMEVAEIFGFDHYDQSETAWDARNNKNCRFRDSRCTKSSKTDPMGICSLSNGQNAAALCPVRFLEDNRIFRDAARIAFGEGANFAVFPEIRILEIEAASDQASSKKIGKVDFLIGMITGGQVCDFAAVEIQAAYFSGFSLKDAFHDYLSNRSFGDHNTKRRPDFRSCAQKRLIPQLQLKIPVFRRWGKKFFVVVDDQFFRSLPTFACTDQNNSELTWLSYPIVKVGALYKMGEPQVIFSEWDVVKNSLREGRPPDPNDIVNELQSKLERMGPKGLRIFQS